MREDAAARVNPAAYLDARTRAVATICGSASADIASKNRETTQTLLFAKLPAHVRALLQSPVTRTSSCSSHDTHQQNLPVQSTSTTELLFFNEHYVVKPPHTDVAFRWHRDDDEQLAMCVHRATIPPYVSAWCALDDVTLENGPLRFVSQTHTRELLGDADIAVLEAHASAPLTVAAGTAIFFRSDVWHCSSANASDDMRRAFYAQYSASRITASPADRSPLSFAIQCLQDESM